MLGIYLFWTSNTVNTRKKAWKKKQAVFYISFQKGQLFHSLSETKKTRTLFYFREIKKESSSHDQSLRLSSGALTSAKNVCVTQGFFYFTKYQRTKRKHSKRCNAVNPEVDGKTAEGAWRNTLLVEVCVLFFFVGWFPLMRHPVNKAPITT